MELHWVCETGDMHSAERCFGQRKALRALVQGLGGIQWDWQVWDEEGRMPQRYGVADTLDEAKACALSGRWRRWPGGSASQRRLAPETRASVISAPSRAKADQEMRVYTPLRGMRCVNSRK